MYPRLRSMVSIAFKRPCTSCTSSHSCAHHKHGNTHATYTETPLAHQGACSEHRYLIHTRPVAVCHPIQNLKLGAFNIKLQDGRQFRRTRCRIMTGNTYQYQVLKTYVQHCSCVQHVCKRLNDGRCHACVAPSDMAIILTGSTR